MSKKYPDFDTMKGVIFYDNEKSTTYTVEKRYNNKILTYAEFLKLVRYVKNLLPKSIKEEVVYDE